MTVFFPVTFFLVIFASTMKATHLLLVLCALLFAGPVSAKKTKDSLLLKLFINAEKYDKVVRHYESDIYIKGVVHLKGKNRFMRRVPQSRTFVGGVKDYFGESSGSLDYTAPFTFDRSVKAVSGTFPVMKEESDMVLDYFNLTIYRESLIEDHLLSPFSLKNYGFYKYSCDSIRGSKAYYTYKPKYNNTQLVKGTFVVNTNRILVEEATFEGKYEFMKFHLKVYMGVAGFMAYLPAQYEFKYHFGFVGNKLDGEYKTVQNYNNVEVVYEPQTPQVARSKYDLTERYAHTVDTSKLVIDSAYVASRRFMPLEKSEQDLYVRWHRRLDSIAQLPSLPAVKKKRTVGDFAEDVLFSHSYINLGKKLGKLRMNPLLDIGLFNYSSSKGYSYRQDFKYVYNYADQRQVVIRPRVGYNIKYKQLFWRLIARYEYLPKLQGAWEIEMGNGNRIKGAIQGADAGSNFSDNYIQGKHELEIFNGFKATVGLVYHSRQPWKMTAQQAAEAGLRQHYKSFSPNVQLRWTPGQYFYMDRNRKEDVYSRFPTFELDYEIGLKGVLGSTSRYERWEFDVSYEWDKDTMHKLSWRLGGGKFTNKSGLEFVEYKSFKKHYLPESWDDELGGRFTLLDSHWYNESLYFLRAHVIYESPMLLLGHLGTKHIKRERLYGSALHTDVFHNYFELGYGIATPVFDLGFYVSAMNGKYSEVGVKYNATLFH